MSRNSYLLGPPHDLLEEVHVRGVHGRQVRLAVLQQEVVELLLGLHLGAQLVDVDRL
jgi:hypothetical protein